MTRDRFGVQHWQVWAAPTWPGRPAQQRDGILAERPAKAGYGCSCRASSRLRILPAGLGDLRAGGADDERLDLLAVAGVRRADDRGQADRRVGEQDLFQLARRGLLDRLPVLPPRHPHRGPTSLSVSGSPLRAGFHPGRGTLARSRWV